MEINIRIEGALTEEDKRILRAIAGEDVQPTADIDIAEEVEIIKQEKIETTTEESTPETPVTNKQDETFTDLDVDGLPWDRRIHASTKTKTQDGRWKKRRGVDDATLQQVLSELQQIMEAPKAEEVNADPLTALVPPPPFNEYNAVSFSDLMRKVGELKTSGKMTQEQFDQLYTDFELPNFASFNQRPDLVAKAYSKACEYE